MLQVLAVFAFPFTMFAEEEGKPSAEKRKDVVTRLQMESDKLGFTPPAWLKPYWETLLGLIVDVLVFMMNRTGFFVHSDSSSKT